jgi:hypothetical protein
MPPFTDWYGPLRTRIFGHTAEKLVDRFNRFKPYLASLRAKLLEHHQLQHYPVLFTFLNAMDRINAGAQNRDPVNRLQQAARTKQQDELIFAIMTLSEIWAEIAQLPDDATESLKGKDMFLSHDLWSVSWRPHLWNLKQMRMHVLFVGSWLTQSGKHAVIQGSNASSTMRRTKSAAPSSRTAS